MQTYHFKMILRSNKTGELAEADLKAAASSEKEARERLLSNPQLQMSIVGHSVVSMDLVDVTAIDSPNSADYVLQRSEQPDWWTAADTKNNFVVRFREKSYNDTAKLTFIFDDSQRSLINEATIIRKIGEWLYMYHRDLL